MQKPVSIGVLVQVQQAESGLQLAAQLFFQGVGKLAAFFFQFFRRQLGWPFSGL